MTQNALDGWPPTEALAGSLEARHRKAAAGDMSIHNTGHITFALSFWDHRQLLDAKMEFCLWRGWRHFSRKNFP